MGVFNFIGYFMLVIFDNNIGYDGVLWIFAVLNLIVIIWIYNFSFYKEWKEEKVLFDQ